MAENLDLNAIQREKKELRTLLRRRLGETSPLQRKKAGIAICRALTQSPLWPPDILLAFLSFKQEIPTSPLILKTLSESLPVAAPRVEGGMICFYLIESPTEGLIPSHYGIYEPPATNKPVIFSRYQRPLILIPGLGFDRAGRRLGRGAGFYDRFLSSHPNLTSVGVCYKTQLLPHIPATPVDQLLQTLCVEKEWIQTSHGREIRGNLL